MLLADKLDLTNKLKLNMLQIEERELNFYTQNCFTVGTQAALLAGFAFTGIVEAPWDYLQDTDENDRSLPFSLKWLTMVSTLLGMLFEILCVAKSMQISILGPGLAIRGPEGSMTRALTVMRVELERLHWQFYIGVIFYHIATGCFCAVLFDLATGITCACILATSLVWLLLDSQKIADRLWLPPPASLWTREADRRPSAPCSCTAATVGPQLTGRRQPPAEAFPALRNGLTDELSFGNHAPLSNPSSADASFVQPRGNARAGYGQDDGVVRYALSTSPARALPGQPLKPASLDRCRGYAPTPWQATHLAHGLRVELSESVAPLGEERPQCGALLPAWRWRERV